MTDPICGMTVNESSKWSVTLQNKKYFFCSEHCLKEFNADPDKYMKLPQEERSQISATTYFPLFLIFSYILGTVILGQMKSGEWNSNHAMSDFMAGFFIVFSFFKFLDFKGFADAYQTYDILAKRSRIYAYLYPFIELGLGVLYFIRAAPMYVSLITIIVMGTSSVGVIQSLLQKRKIQCACLGTVFKLPMTKITLFEDLLMVAMALFAVLSIT